MQWNELKTHLRHIGVQDQKRIQKAFELGKEKHHGQKRKSGEPYFMHPIAVTHILAEMGADADTLIAALLHDTVEDTDLTLKEIDKAFNGDVSTLIDGVTKLEPEDVAENPTLDDQIETLRKTFTLIEEDARVIVIKLVDRLHNMQTVSHLSTKRQLAMAQETMDVYVKIADRLSMHEIGDELESLCLSVLDDEEFQSLVKIRESNEIQAKKAIRNINKVLKKEYPDFEDFMQLQYEQKTWSKLRMQRNISKAKTGVSDIVVSIVCEEEADCYEALGILHRHWLRETSSFQDFINAPMINGYRGLHTTIILENGIRVRCKIRTNAMQDYAQHGIATLCFDNKRQGVMEYLLPWTQRISALAKDTVKHSSEFWESLQNDILGESMVIHGPDDSRVMLPAGSTALDGAFYFLHKKALNIKEIDLDGNTVDFHAPLTHACTLNFSRGKQKTVRREWLDWVNSGLAVALIREALSKESDSIREAAGKTLLQKVLTQEKKGYVEELNEQAVQIAGAKLGYATTSETFRAVSDGHIKPEDLYNHLYLNRRRTTAKSNEKKAVYTINFTLNLDDISAIEKVLKVYKKYHVSITSVRFRPLQIMRGRISIKHPLSAKEHISIKKDLLTAGTKDVIIRKRGTRRTFWVGVAVLLTLWGFDPAVARYIIREYGVSPIDLTLLRFWTLAGMSGLLVVWKRLRSETIHAPLPLKSKTLWVSGLLMILVALFGYTSLQTTQAINYSLPMTAGGLLLTTIVNAKLRKTLAVTWLLLIAGTGYAIAHTPSWPAEGVVTTLLTVLVFSMFSVISERFKRNEHIGARIAQYFFALSGICAILTLPLLAFSSIGTLSGEAVWHILLFSFCFAGLPYYMYYNLLSYKQIDFVLRYSFVILYTTMLGQVIISGDPISQTALIASAVVSVGALLPIVRTKMHIR